MAVSEPMAYAIFASYCGLIFTSFGFVVRSLVKDVPAKRLLENKPFLFLRIAVGALAFTWYFMLSYMKWSFDEYTRSNPGASIGAWLSNTALFEEAWTIVCSTPERWTISSWICTWTVLFTFIVYTESGRRGIRHPWAYMLLGQLVAVSFSTALFYTACSLRPRKYFIDPTRVRLLIAPLLIALVTIYRTPSVVNTDGFMPNLLVMHAALVVPLLLPAKSTPPTETSSSKTCFTLLLFAMAFIHSSIPPLFPKELPNYTEGFKRLYDTVLSHPAQGSISLDVIWSAIAIAFWFFTEGSIIVIALKVATLIATISGIWIRKTGINWTFVCSIVPIGGLAVYGLITALLGSVRGKNDAKRKAALESLGIIEENVIPGTDKAPPSFAPRRTIAGFWHPFCNAGGGGERVLWTGIAHLQRVHPDVVSVVYTGDFPKASKTEILSKIKERFSINLSPNTLIFVPLRSRHLVDDGYWKRFTLLGQSFGSMWLVWERLTGKEGFWGDIFVDTMGYAFTFPLVRFIAGDEITIGTYTHYPTVSADMVARVKARSFGVENAGASGSWLRTQVKLIYYRIFTSLYAFSLLFSEYSMTNSSWTQAHFTSLLTKARGGVLANLFLMDETALKKNGGEKAACEVVFPPCDTGALTGFKLDGRSKEIVSLAQFRPEKEQWKQIEALAILLERYPRWRQEGVKLVLMGGARHPADEQRVTDLRELAKKRGVEDCVEFVVNAPYGTVVDRLGRASLGLNTMQDEHFGINVVEFMAAGLIPVVHASAGPLMDIVVPHKGQRTGFHAKTAEEFAEALNEAMSLSADQQMKMRRAARELAVAKFSEERFEEGWERAWGVLERKSLDRLRIRRD